MQTQPVLRVHELTTCFDGDDTTVVVVDTGSSDTYGLILGVVPIDDGARADQLEAAIASLEIG